MRTRGPTGGAYVADEFSPGHHLAALDGDAVQVGEARGQAGVVLQSDAQAIGAVATGEGDGAPGRGVDGGAPGGGNVDALVEFPLAGEGRGPPGEAGSNPAGRGPDGRGGFKDALVVTQGVHNLLLADLFEAGLDVQLAQEFVVQAHHQQDDYNVDQYNLGHGSVPGFRWHQCTL